MTNSMTLILILTTSAAINIYKYWTKNFWWETFFNIKIMMSKLCSKDRSFGQMLKVYDRNVGQVAKFFRKTEIMVNCINLIRKIQILIKYRYFGQIRKFWSNKEILVKYRNFRQIIGCPRSKMTCDKNLKLLRKLVVHGLRWKK